MPVDKTKKAPGAFRTISEVAEDLDLPQHVLRFWETKFTQVRPMKRGGGRRYYRPEDVALLRNIQSLLYDEGYTIKGVQKLLRDGSLKKSDLKDDAMPDAPASPEKAQAEIRNAIAELEALRADLNSAL
ncbi:MAG: MerR family transcriptional regulator [Rhodospirillaceae bacterium]